VNAWVLSRGLFVLPEVSTPCFRIVELPGYNLNCYKKKLLKLLHCVGVPCFAGHRYITQKSYDNKLTYIFFKVKQSALPLRGDVVTMDMGM